MGISIEEIFNQFLNSLDKKQAVLEIGCNIGLKLSILEKMQFKNLYGLEINKNALEVARKNHPNIKFFNSSIEEFNPNGYEFDLVYTSNVLIHINPSILDQIIKKIINLSKKFIFGYEYFSENLEEIKYRGHDDVLWKQNFPNCFIKTGKVKVLKENKFYYYKENLCDIAYLLEKV